MRVAAALPGLRIGLFSFDQFAAEAMDLALLRPPPGRRKVLARSTAGAIIAVWGHCDQQVPIHGRVGTTVIPGERGYHGVVT